MANANLGLFDNERETNLQSTAAMIEDALVELGHFINNCRVEQPGAHRAWRIQKGSAELLIALTDADDFTHLRVTATVMTADGDTPREALFARLLELNETHLCGIAFALRGSQVRLVAERSTLDLDRSEVLDLVHRSQTCADHYDDLLVSEFGGTVGGPVLL